jgi:hypothetical protein
MPYGTVNTDILQGTLGGIVSPDSSVFRNRIINGAMTISQRGVSPTIGGGGDYSVDRFFNYYTGTAYTSVQSTVAPTGFKNSLLLTTTTASASPTYSFFGHKIEGLNCFDLGFGTAAALTVTLSFWVRSSVTGIYSIAIGNDDGNRAYAVQYTINTANTWEKKTMTVPGDTTGTWPTTNASCIFLRWNMGTSASSRLISTGSWQVANADGATGSTGANTWANTLGATFYITGVQLEAGSTASSFEYRQYTTELALCQRYYYTSGDLTNPANGRGGFTGFPYSNGTEAYGSAKFAVTMRAAPAVTMFDNSGTLGTVTQAGQANGIAATAVSINSQGFFSVLKSSGSWASTSSNYPVVGGFTASSEL